MPDPKKEDPSKTAPQTIEQLVASVQDSMKILKLKVREGTKPEDFLFALQQTFGKKFKEIPENYAKIAGYYSDISCTISENPNDIKALGLLVDGLKDMTFKNDDPELSNKVGGLLKANKEMKLVVGFYKRDPENEFANDKRIVVDTDNVDESLEFRIGGKDKMFAKQYLASLLEPITDDTAPSTSTTKPSVPVIQTSSESLGAANLPTKSNLPKTVMPADTTAQVKVAIKQ